MKKKINLLLSGMVLIALCSWRMQAEKHVKHAEWLIGTWVNKTKTGSVYETWHKAGDNKLSGKSYVVSRKDTMVFETIDLVQKQDSCFYIPTIKQQNGGTPVRFHATLITANKMVFENAKHDFPQIISYTLINPDSLMAEISGTIKGKKRTQLFAMKKVN
ncbi:MAG: DUF6265 family protein [Bacteroidota bacterium]